MVKPGDWALNILHEKHRVAIRIVQPELVGAPGGIPAEGIGSDTSAADDLREPRLNVTNEDADNGAAQQGVGGRSGVPLKVEKMAVPLQHGVPPVVEHRLEPKYFLVPKYVPGDVRTGQYGGDVQQLLVHGTDEVMPRTGP